jgi:hypothetical protein
MQRCAPWRLWYLSTCWTVVWLVAFAVLHAACAQGTSLEYAVKATYLHKFAPFVEWPDPAAEFPGGEFIICVVGNDPLGAVLDRAVSGQDVAGRPIAVHRFSDLTSNPSCAVMYVTGSDAKSIAGILAAVHGAPVLTVTDGATDPAAKGIINFIIQDDRVRFEIDDSAAAANGLTISSKLLNLAVHVSGGSR